MNVSNYINETNPELARFLEEEFKGVPECSYPTNNRYIPTKDELRNFSDDELTDILMDAGLEADMSIDEDESKFMVDRYEFIKMLVTQERSRRRNEI